MGSEGQEIPPIKVGIIGGGYGISTLLPAISSISEFDVTSIARSGHASRTYDGGDLENSKIVFLSAAEIIEDPHVDLVVIACPPSAQEKYAIAALENRKSIFCEKPGGLNVEATRRISAKIAATGGRAIIGYQFRYEPLIKWLSKIVSEGGLGKIQKIDISWETSGAANTPVNSWRNNPEMGGGVLRDFTSHIFDYMGIIDPFNFGLYSEDKRTYTNHNVKRNISQIDFQEIDFSAQFGSAQFRCKVSRKITDPLGHKITIQGENGVAEAIHRSPFGLTDMSARFWLDSNVEVEDRTYELSLAAIAEDLEKYKLDLRQLAARNLFVEFALLLRGGTALNLPDFGHGISNQLYIEDVEKALFSR